MEEYLVHTGQHYDAGMSQVFFDELEIPLPQLNLGVGSGSHAEQTGAMLLGLERAMQRVQPDLVLVYGDTNSTVAGALAAAKLHMPVAHVEAGLRSFNRCMPEEINRVVTDALSEVLFAPTQLAVANLLREGANSNGIQMVGDVMFDAALMFGERARTRSRIIEQLKLNPNSYLLATVHRAENTNDQTRLRNIFLAFAEIAKTTPVLVPLHPRTRIALEKTGLAGELEALKILDPLGYLDMIRLEQNAAVIATDSGGVQKEAFFYEVPCVTLRSETEWTELVDLGWNRLCTPDSPAAIAQTILSAVGARGDHATPYGCGDSAEKIALVLRTR